MQRIKILDNIAAWILCFWATFTLFGIDVFKFDVSEYNKSLGAIERCFTNIFCLLSLLTLLFLLRRKYSWLQNLEKVGWIVFFIVIPYLVHEIPSISQAYTDSQNIISEK